MADVNPEYGPPGYELLRNSDRQFALSAEILIPGLGDSVFTQAQAGRYLAEATDGEIDAFPVNNFRVPGWVVEARGRGKLRLNPGALITPKNIVRSQVTSGVIAAALEQTGEDYRDQVGELLTNLGVQGEDPIQAKDTHAFGYVMRPRKGDFSQELGLMALLDARITDGDSGQPKFTSVKDMMKYFEEDLGGYVLTHLRLKGLIDRMLDIPDINPNRSGSIVNDFSGKYNCFSPDDPLLGRVKRINGVILKKPTKEIGGLVVLDQIHAKYKDLEDLKNPGEPKVQISIPSEIPKKTEPKDTLNAQKSKKEAKNGSSEVQDAVNSVNVILKGLKGANIDLGFYKEQIKAAEKNGDLEDLQFIAAELESISNK